MSIFSALFGSSHSQAGEDLVIAEAYIREECTDDQHISALVRHYPAGETADIIEQFTGARVTDHQVVEIVQKIRNEYGMGPMADYNLPGFVDPSDYPEDQEDQRAYNAEREQRNAQIAEEQSRGGFLGWLFG